MERQLSLFAAGELPPDLTDLEGLLPGCGRLARRDGLVRLSAVVDAPWRATALLAAFAERGLPGETAPLTGSAEPSGPAEPAGGGTCDEGRLVVRTAFTRVLVPLADRWTQGASWRPPADLTLDGPRLRLWAVACGRYDPYGYLLPLAGTAPEAPAWAAVGAALHAVGLTGTLLGPRAGGPAYRITGHRRLGRLAELVGDPPPGAGATHWPA